MEGCWLLPTALLPGLLHHAVVHHRTSSAQTLCFVPAVAAVEVSADLAYSLLCAALWVSHLGGSSGRSRRGGSR